MPAGQIQTYKEVGTLKRAVNEAFLLSSPKIIPLLKLISGGNDEEPTLNSIEDVDFRADRVEWYEDQLRPVSFVLGAAMTNVQTTIQLTPVTDGLHLVKGAVLELATGEQVLVTAQGDEATGIATISRGWAGTTAAAQTNSTAVQMVTRTHESGTAAPADPWSAPVAYYNTPQEIIEEMNISFMEQQMKRYTMDPGGYRDRRKLKAMKEVFKALERGLFYGKRVLTANGVPGTYGGMRTFIAGTNVKTLAAPFVPDDLNTLMQGIYDGAGPDMVPDTLLVSSACKIKISKAYSTSTVSVWRESKEVKGGVVVNGLSTDFGDIDVVVDIWSPKASMWAINREMLSFGPLGDADLRWEELARDGTYTREQLVGIYSFVMRGSNCHGVIDNALL